MGKIVVGLFVGYILILLTIFAANVSYGEKLDYQKLNMIKYSNLEDQKATCENYHGEVISNMEIYQDFLEDCELTATFDYDETYFNNNVFIIYFYEGGVSHEPKGFYDYLFSLNGKEIIRIKFEKAVFPIKASTWDAYFVELEKKDIISSEIIFD